MNKSPRHFGCWLISGGIVVVLVAGDLFARAETNSTTAMDKAFLKTNGDLVTIGNIAVKKSSRLNTDEFKQYMWRTHLLDQIADSRSSNATDRLAEGAWALSKDYPNELNGYFLVMSAMERYVFEGKPEKARTLANELIESPAPERSKLWAEGFLNRLDSYGKPVSIRFKALDGREVDLANMNGKVVLVVFWQIYNGPDAELARVKAAYDKFHGRGFEIIGINCDTDKKALKDHLKQQDISWPQYFDGKQQESNKLAQGFGIDGIPHMFLVDKKGCLRFDNVRARDRFHPKGDTTSMEEKISKLLAED